MKVALTGATRYIGSHVPTELQAHGHEAPVKTAKSFGLPIVHSTLRAGRSVVIANSRGPGSLTSVVSALGAGASAGSQASAAGIVVIAVPGPASRRPSRDSNGTVRS